MKVDRLVSIIMILLEKKRVSAEQLANIFEVSTRTVYRDIESICMAGIPIRAVSGTGGGFEIMPDYKLERGVFTSEDLSTLLMGLAGLSSVVRGDEIVHTLSKVKSFIPPEQAEQIRIRSSQVCIDTDAWMGNPDIRTNLEGIRTALRQTRLLSFYYIGQHGSMKTRSAEPYQLISKNGSWYLYAFCCLRKDFRLFKLARMIDLKLTEESFTPRDFPQPRLNASEIIAPLQTDITLRIHESIAERILDCCSYSRFRRDGDEHYIVNFPFIDREYFYDTLLGFGSKCICIGPPEIREKLAARIRELNALYS